MKTEKAAPEPLSSGRHEARVYTYRRGSNWRQQGSAIKNFLCAETRRNWVVRRQLGDKAGRGDDPSRNGIKEILGAARRREFDVLVVFAQHKLARGIEVLKPILNELEENCVEVYDATGRRIALNDPESAIQKIVMEMISEVELRTIRGRRSKDRGK